MTELIGCILSSSVLFLLFRLFPKYNVDTAQAIVVNYFTAFVCGWIINGQLPQLSGLNASGLLPFALLSGFLFVSLFIAMGISAAKNGMGTTSVAVKMSLALSMIFFIIAYDESLTVLKTAGILLAFAGIFLVTYEKDTKKQSSYKLLLLLMVGRAVLDIVLNYVEQNLNGYPSSLYTAFGFLAAGSFGLIWMTTEYLRGKRQFSWRNIVGGILLGIPNYFSIYLLVRSYSTTGWSDSTTLAVAGIGIVLISSICGMIVFKESAKTQRLLGIAAAVSAIALLALDAVR